MKRTAVLALSLLLFCGPAQAKTASASLEGIGSSTWTSGAVTFREEKDGLRIRADVKSANPGKHGIHIHETGSCEQNGSAAGNHFNPAETLHGDLLKNGFSAAHAGDLGNMEIGSDGTGKLDIFVPGLSLSSGDYVVLGRSIVLNEKEDDLTSQPAGNSGARIACGVIN